jgi:hypothetical protein
MEEVTYQQNDTQIAEDKMHTRITDPEPPTGPPPGLPGAIDPVRIDPGRTDPVLTRLMRDGTPPDGSWWTMPPAP